MATVLMSSSRQAEMIRSAISPRLAIRIFLNTRERLSGRQSNPEELLPVLDRLAVARIDGDDLPLDVRLDLVHQLHRLDDAENFTLRHARTHLGEGFRFGGRRAIERPDDRGRDHVDVL